MNGLKEITRELESVEKKLKSPFRFFIKNWLIKKRTLLNRSLDLSLVEHISADNENFRKLVEENKQLLCNENIQFKVTSEGSSPWTYMTKRFEGRIHSNGFLYLQAKSNAIEFLEILSHFYPSKYIGTMTPLGLAEANAASTDFQIIGGRVPEVFRGQIDLNGTITFETTDSWFEIDGHIHVSKIIADPFKGNNHKRELFLRNRSEIRSSINNWKKQNIKF